MCDSGQSSMLQIGMIAFVDISLTITRQTAVNCFEEWGSSSLLDCVLCPVQGYRRERRLGNTWAVVHLFVVKPDTFTRRDSSVWPMQRDPHPETAWWDWNDLVEVSFTPH
jgi:hypothetical protein